MNTTALNDQISIVTTSKRILLFSLETRCSTLQLGISGLVIVVVCGVHSVYYRIDGDIVEIMSVLRAQDTDKHLPKD